MRTIASRASTIMNGLWTGGTVGLRVVGRKAISELNRRYRGVDAATDVLSFPADDPAHHGDIALCWELAVRQARANGNAVEDEALALVCHGLLHLAGYRHDTAEGDAEMTGRTVELCRAAGTEVSTFGH